jgi:hypothetical protein
MLRRPRLVSLALPLALAALGGCKYEFSWVQENKTLPPEQGDKCFFEIREDLPADGYVLLAEFTAQRHVADTPKTEDGLRDSIENQVCSLGGKVVVTHRNPNGHFTRGKVYVHREDQSL